MEYPRNTQMNQTQPPPPPPPPSHPQHHYFGNGFPYQSLSPATLNNLPPSIDVVDQTLANVLSSLSLSQNYSDCRSFLPHTLDYEYGGVTSPIAGEGFISPFRINSVNTSSCYDDEIESWRVSNAVNNHQRVYYGVGHDTPVTVDPLSRHHHYLYSSSSSPPPLPCYNNREFQFLPSSSSSSSWFDPRFDFDQMSYLLAKERLYSTQQQQQQQQQLNSYHHNCCSPDESVFHTNNFNNVNRNHGNRLQNQQVLSGRPLKELRGVILLLAKDQNGCRILQSKFENPSKEEIELVLSQVIGSICDLMKHQFGNYLIQKLVAVCNADQKGVILHELTDKPYDIILISMSPYGTRAMQSLLENLEDPHQIMMVTRALHHGAAKLASDPNGHHVIQSCLVNFDSNFNQLILDDIANNCFNVATDKSGCCVLQACLDHSHGKVRNRLVTEIMLNALQIAEDPFGNYVLQHMVGMKNHELTQLLVRQLKGHFACLSRNKYASNVVEKCLTETESDIRENIIFELIKSPNSSALLLDPYGNFVIQSALNASKEGLAYECLRKLISRNELTMQSNLYGKKILESMDKKRMIRI